MLRTYLVYSMTELNNLWSFNGSLIVNVVVQFLPRIYELGRSPSAGVMVQHILDDTAKAITSELTEEIQVEHKSCSSLKHYTLMDPLETLQSRVVAYVIDCSALRDVSGCDVLNRSRLRPCCSLLSPPALGSSRGQV